MADLEKVVCAWSQFTGAPGYSVFYGPDAATLLPVLHTFFEAIKAVFPAPLTITYPTNGFIIDDLTGAQTGTWTTTAQTATVGTGTGAYVGTAGPVVSWRTSSLTPVVPGVRGGGKLLRGRTYLVPVIIGQFDNQGNISGSCVTLIQSAANAVAASTKLGAWHRPKGGTGGMSAQVTTALVTNLPATMRSRRR